VAQNDARRRAYADRLKDPRWQKRRLEILQRDGWACHGCDATTRTLHVHHKYYRANSEPWDYPDSALVTLCEDCHAVESELENKRRDDERSVVEVMRELGIDAEGVLLLMQEIGRHAWSHKEWRSAVPNASIDERPCSADEIINCLAGAISELLRPAASADQRLLWDGMRAAFGRPGFVTAVIALRADALRDAEAMSYETYRNRTQSLAGSVEG